MNRTNTNQSTDEVPIYQAPTITTYTAEELLEIVGPVHAIDSMLKDSGPMGSTGDNGLQKILKLV